MDDESSDRAACFLHLQNQTAWWFKIFTDKYATCHLCYQPEGDWCPLNRREELLGVLQHRGYNDFTHVGCVEDRLFVIGGWLLTNRISSFNVETRRPQPVAMMKERRAMCAIASAKHELLVCGGWRQYPGSLSFCEVLYGDRNKWEEIPSLQQARRSSQVVWLPTGQIFVMGGCDGEHYLNSVEFLSRHWYGVGDTAATASGHWRYVASMLKKRSCFGVVYFAKIILIAGGCNQKEGYSSYADLFAPATERGQWTQVQSMQSAMQIFSGVVSSGAIFMFGCRSEGEIQRLIKRHAKA